MFLVPLGLSSYLPHMRFGSYVPILAVLALMFVIPHDPSTRMAQTTVGADGHTVPVRQQPPAGMSTTLRRLRSRPARTLLRSARVAARVGLRKASTEWAEVGQALQPRPRPTLPKAARNCTF